MKNVIEGLMCLHTGDKAYPSPVSGTKPYVWLTSHGELVQVPKMRFIACVQIPQAEGEKLNEKLERKKKTCNPFNI